MRVILQYGIKTTGVYSVVTWQTIVACLCLWRLLVPFISLPLSLEDVPEDHSISVM